MTSDGFGDDKTGHFISMRDTIDGRVVDRTPIRFTEEIRFWPEDDTVICYHCGTSIYGGRVRELVKQYPIERRTVELGADGKPYAHLVAVADWLIRQGIRRRARSGNRMASRSCRCGILWIRP